MAKIDIDVGVRIKPVNKITDQVLLKVQDGAWLAVGAHEAIRALLAPVLNGNGSASVPVPLAAVPVSGVKIGEQGTYGIRAGVARADEQGGDHWVDVLAEAPEKLTWADAMKWAESIGGALPTRKQQALLFANVSELFQKDYYWSSEQYAGNESYAWYQGFDGGDQTYGRKVNHLRARAVRRLPIE